MRQGGRRKRAALAAAAAAAAAASADVDGGVVTLEEDGLADFANEMLLPAEEVEKLGYGAGPSSAGGMLLGGSAGGSGPGGSGLDPVMALTAASVVAGDVMAHPPPSKRKRSKHEMAELVNMAEAGPQDTYLFDGKWHSAAEWKALKEKQSMSAGCSARYRSDEHAVRAHTCSPAVITCATCAARRATAQWGPCARAATRPGKKRFCARLSTTLWRSVAWPRAPPRSGLVGRAAPLTSDGFANVRAQGGTFLGQETGVKRDVMEGYLYRDRKDQKDERMRQFWLRMGTHCQLGLGLGCAAWGRRTQRIVLA